MAGQASGPAIEDWVGREEVQFDVIHPGPIKRLVSTLRDAEISPAPGDPTPLLAHWAYFLPFTPPSQLGPDGHPRRGGFLPPVPLPRRMWAGSNITFHRPLQVGAHVTRRSTVASVERKEGRTGQLVFVRVNREIGDSQGAIITDSHTIVYRDLTQPDAPAPAAQMAPIASQWRRRVVPDPVLLFRYSALTFNGHPIHYDRSYASEVEGYPGLVVHGPLIATLLLHELMAQHPGRDVATYSFRAVKPIFDTAPFDVCGSLGPNGTAELFARDEGGALCMTAIAQLR